MRLIPKQCVDNVRVIEATQEITFRPMKGGVKDTVPCLCALNCHDARFSVMKCPLKCEALENESSFAREVHGREQVSVPTAMLVSSGRWVRASGGDVEFTKKSITSGMLGSAETSKIQADGDVKKLRGIFLKEFGFQQLHRSLSRIVEETIADDEEVRLC